MGHYLSSSNICEFDLQKNKLQIFPGLSAIIKEMNIFLNFFCHSLLDSRLRGNDRNRSGMTEEENNRNHIVLPNV